MNADDSKRPPSDPSPAPRDDPPDETAHADDAIIGRATRWSSMVIVLALALAGGVLAWLQRQPRDATVQVTPLAAPVAPSRGQVRPTEVRFKDITASSGISFSRFNGAEGEKLLPETMGGGVAFFDFDNDGDPDLLFVNGAPWPWAKTPPSPSPTHALYRNDGTGRFSDVTAGSGLDVSTQGMGVACGDFDHDGHVDVFITNVGSNLLLRNLGNGKFQDVTASAGVSGDPGEWSSSAAFLDFDRDGDLDLFVANYVRWSKEIDFQVGYSLDGKSRAYGPPMNFRGTYPYLYRNEGRGKFTDVSATAGVQVRNVSTSVPAAKSLGVAVADINHDDWIDLVVANDTVQNYAFTNRHDGTFAEAGEFLGIAFDSIGNARGAMGIDVGRHRNDASFAIAVGNFANEMSALYVSQGNSGHFADEAIAEGVGPASRLQLKFGMTFLDYDLDGWLDLLSANGHLEEEISKIQQSQHYRQPAQLFWNAGGSPKGGGFLEVKSDLAGADLFKPIVGRGSAVADIDGDGDLDVVLVQAHGPPLLLRNDQNTGNRWVRIQLRGQTSNTDAIGARITVSAGGTTQTRHVSPTRSYLSQSELPITLGLGLATSIESAEVVWPDGRRQRIDGLSPGTRNVIQEVPR